MTHALAFPNIRAEQTTTTREEDDEMSLEMVTPSATDVDDR